MLWACLRLRDALSAALNAPEYSRIGYRLLGPAPAAVARGNDRYRYRLVLYARNQKELRELIAHLLRQAQKDKNNRGVSLFADVNPMD